MQTVSLYVRRDNLVLITKKCPLLFGQKKPHNEVIPWARCYVDLPVKDSVLSLY